MNRAKSRNDNPSKIYDQVPVIPLMTSVMKMTSLQNSGYSFMPRCIGRGWPEETSSTHFCLVTATFTDLPPGSAAIHAEIDVCSWQIAWTTIYMERCCLAKWGEESLSRTISSHSMVLSLHLASRNYIWRNCFAFKLFCWVALFIRNLVWHQNQGRRKDLSLWVLLYIIIHWATELKPNTYNMWLSHNFCVSS